MDHEWHVVAVVSWWLMQPGCPYAQMWASARTACTPVLTVQQAGKRADVYVKHAHTQTRTNTKSNSCGWWHNNMFWVRLGHKKRKPAAPCMHNVCAAACTSPPTMPRNQVSTPCMTLHHLQTPADTSAAEHHTPGVTAAITGAACFQLQPGTARMRNPEPHTQCHR
jgi:hypothetical protein